MLTVAVWLCVQQLIDAVARQDVTKTILVLSYCNSTSKEPVSAQFSQSDWRTALHIAAFLGNVVILQLLLWVRCVSCILFFFAIFVRRNYSFILLLHLPLIPSDDYYLGEPALSSFCWLFSFTCFRRTFVV